MNKRLSTILHGLGLLLHVPGIMALVSIIISVLAGEYYAIPAFLWTAGISLVLGQLLYRIFQSSEETPLGTMMLIAALGWAAVSVVGAVPFLFIALHPGAYEAAPQAMRVFQDPWNALFESVSGYTSTGLTMAQRPEDLPLSLHWWRSLTQWIGGVGVIVLMLSVVQSTPGLYRLYYSEARDDKLFPSVSSTVRTIWWIYLLYTLGGIVLLRLTGMPWWAALNHGMTGIATGGFAITSNSIGAYGFSAQLAVIPLMLLGAISFGTHYRILSQRNPTVLWHDAQHRVLIIVVLVGSLLVMLEQSWFTGELRWIEGVFQWVSALTTCGFSTVDLRPWSPSAKLLLTLAMLSGGAAGSTVGGIKLSRLVLLFKGIQWRFQQLNLRPHQLMRYTLNRQVLSENEAFARVESTTVMVALWLLTLIGAVAVLLHTANTAYSTGEVLFEAVSALSNAGLSMGITEPTLPWPGKLTLMLCMWMGRLEVVPVALLIARFLGTTTRAPQ